MTDEGYKRKLTAIFSADVVGYSRLMGEDEAGTVKTLIASRKIMGELIRQSRGRVIDSPGDNILAEFASVVDAVKCAVAVQKEFKARNAGLPENRRMEFRIGVNLGDVIEEEDRIYGDGVNIAARLEALADPGGICVSKTAFEHTESKLALGYEYLGEQEVKNIARPVGAYRVLLEPRAAVAKAKEKEKAIPVWRRTSTMAGGVAIILVVIAALTWNYYFRYTPGNPASVDKVASPLPDLPSIAVLPFENMSGDREQEYFSDGMTDDIITDLSKIKDLLVISRNSTFTYKGRGKKIPEIAKELNVRYVLEGSVRKVGDQIRINAQLIDAKTDHHIWAERFDGTIEDVFVLQDQLSTKIVAALAVKLSGSEQKIIADKGTGNIPAYDAYLKGMMHMRKFTPDDYVEAIRYFKQAIKLDQNYSQPYAALAYTYWSTFAGGKRFGDKIGIDYILGRILARHYLQSAMKKPTSMAYQVMALMELFRRNFKEAIAYSEKSVANSPNDAYALYNLGVVTILSGNPETGIKYIKKANMLDPLSKDTIPMGFGYFILGDYAKTVEYITIGLADKPDKIAYLAYTAAAHAFLDNDNEAKTVLEKWLTCFEGRYPSGQMLYYLYPFKNPAVFDRLMEGLMKAGYKTNPSDYYHVDEENRLKGQEIRELLFGKTQIGYFSGFQWSNFRNKDGEIQSPSPWGEVDKGKSWIEDDELYNQFEMRYDGLKYSCNIYSNPEGDEKTKSNYLSVCDFAIVPFAVED